MDSALQLRAMCWVLGSLLVGCAQILGTDDYEKSRADAGTMRDASSASSDGGGPLFAAKPAYLAGSKCLACLDDNCHAEDVACSADTFCSSSIEEARHLAGPLIAAQDLLAKTDATHWAADHGANNGWSVRVDFETCAVNHCVDACGLGRDFSCVGQFDWQASYPRQAELELRFVDVLDPNSGFDGWSVRACETETDCEHPLGQATTADGGFAKPVLDFSLSREPVSEFFGFLRVDAGADYFPEQFHESRPFLDHEYDVFRAQTRASILGIATARNIVIDDSQALLLLFPQDCADSRVTIWRAKGVTIEIWKPDSMGFHRCADCAVAYPDDTGLPDVTVKDYSARTSGAVSALVPPGNIMVVVRDTETRLPVSVMQSVTVRAGYLHEFHLFPASRAQLAGLPDEVRR